ncbi:expressed unknown protein [Seminavis robusta]|uniref:Uncharacterized protein n=1 Tax=Seminavis robusta TaxID=568900 RepID=A0A9N8DFK7_9STRA|nr:expressed unknown protein [Seminavis robusta]|eukprot:Sro126_g060460.1 n/a (174) ;mRNA; f:16589-17110
MAKLLLNFLFLMLTIRASFGFVPSCRRTQATHRIPLLQAAENDDNDGQPQQQPDPVETFMEQASQKGADKVRAMSIEERTRRAMLAEAVEDRIFTMYDDLEGLLQDGVPVSEQDREEIQSLAQEIKASQSQYETLVSGEPSVMLGTINDIGSPSSSNTQAPTEEDGIDGDAQQ